MTEVKVISGDIFIVIENMMKGWAALRVMIMRGERINVDNGLLKETMADQHMSEEGDNKRGESTSTSDEGYRQILDNDNSERMENDCITMAARVWHNREGRYNYKNDKERVLEADMLMNKLNRWRLGSKREHGMKERVEMAMIMKVLGDEVKSSELIEEHYRLGEDLLVAKGITEARRWLTNNINFEWAREKMIHMKTCTGETRMELKFPAIGKNGDVMEQVREVVERTEIKILITGDLMEQKNTTTRDIDTTRTVGGNDRWEGIANYKILVDGVEDGYVGVKGYVEGRSLVMGIDINWVGEALGMIMGWAVTGVANAVGHNEENEEALWGVRIDGETGDIDEVMEEVMNMYDKIDKLEIRQSEFDNYSSVLDKVLGELEINITN
jgi:hypothetical protein